MRLDDVPREWLVAIAALALGYALWVWIRNGLKRLAMERRFAHGAEGEKAARTLLVRSGFTIEGAQVAGGYVLAIDGAPVEISLRADYLVSKNGARYVAEVKTGDVAPRIETAATRRQLLEYQHAFDVDGILLVDAEARRISRVDFSGGEPALGEPAAR